MSSVQFLVGKTLGRYQVLDHIGHGGMSEVYKGIQEQLDRPVAIKVLHPFLADEEGFVVRFRREARIVATLRHANIVQVYDFDENEEFEVYYMVMEYIDGPTLKDRLNDGPITPEETAAIGAAISDALEYAHKRDMVHRDIKPANIMFTSDGQPVLTDFGIAKMLTLSGLTASGAMVGTPAYMAPEVGMGKPGTVASDIYSMGVVLYQMITGKLPFESESPMGMVMQHINDTPPPPKHFMPDLPAALDAVILHALEKEPEARFGSAAEMASALRHIATGLADTGAPSPEMVRKPTPPPPGEDLDEDDMLLRTWPAGPAPDNTLTQAKGKAVTTPAEPDQSLSTKKPRGSLIWRLFRTVLLLLIVVAAAAVGWISLGGSIPSDLLAVLPFEAVLPTVKTVQSPTVEPSPPPTLASELESTPMPTDVEVTVSAPTATPVLPPTETPVLECVLRVKPDTVIIDPDDIVAPETALTVYVPLRNTGSCAWPEGLQFRFVSGERMDAASPLSIKALAPNEGAQLIIPMRAPTETGVYEARWELRQPNGESLGNAITIEVEVSDVPGPTPLPEVVPTEEPEPEPLVIEEPLLLTWREDVATGLWYGTVAFQAAGGEGGYRYYQSEVREENFSPDGIFSFQMQRCVDFPLTIWVLSGEEAVSWDSVIPYPEPDRCQ